MALKQAREGTKSTIEHDIQSSRGQYFQAHTNLYRGSPTANELNPTFILAQTRFIGSNLTSSSPGISEVCENLVKCQSVCLICYREY